MGKQKKLWHKGHDRMMVGCGHKSRVGVFRMCNLETRKMHDTRNVRWMGMMILARDQADLEC